VTFKFLDVQSLSKLFLISFHKDLATWPLGRHTRAHRHVYASHPSVRIAPFLSKYLQIAADSNGLVTLRVVRSNARRRINPPPTSSDPWGNKLPTGSRSGMRAFKVLTWQWQTPLSDMLIYGSLCCLISSLRFPIVLSIAHCATMIPGPIRVVSGAKCEAVWIHGQTKWIRSACCWTYSSSNPSENSVMSWCASMSSSGMMSSCIKIRNAFTALQ
jgi:hypothetical protein